MNIHTLQATVQELFSKGKGILAADASIPTMNKRLLAEGIEQTEEARRRYRQLLFTTANIEKYISGVILYDGTIRQSHDDGTPFATLLTKKGIVPGIKVDKSTREFTNFPGERITDGLDGLTERLQEYKEMGARFAKWRAVITIGDNIPTDTCISANAHALARYASLCQEQDIVPIVEPEVLLSGDHDIVKAEEVTTETLIETFAQLKNYRVALSGVILKSSMVLPGDKVEGQADAEEIAEATLKTFQNSVPDEVPGVVFLSGGQSPQHATENLNAVARFGRQPWAITFSYSRALQESVLSAWGGNNANIDIAQREFIKRMRLNSKAQLGKYTAVMEKEE